MNGSYELVIKPRSGWQPIDWREAFLHRELLGFLVWRDIKIRYRQTALGGSPRPPPFIRQHLALAFNVSRTSQVSNDQYAEVHDAGIYL